MKTELRADGLHISGYINTSMRESRPIIVKGIKVNELIEERVFEQALGEVNNIPLLLDHLENREIANTSNTTMELREDNIGLHAEVVTTDPEVIANKHRLRGWSFGMQRVVDSIEERADKLPLRRIKKLTLDHIALVLNKVPAYSATSIELRANDEEIEIEFRTVEETVEDKTVETPLKETINYSQYDNRILEIKAGI